MGYGNNKGGGRQGGGSKNKPDWRFAIMEKQDDKWVTVKGDDGKTVYVGSGWNNDYGGINISIEDDIPAGARLRAYDANAPREDRGGGNKGGGQRNGSSGGGKPQAKKNGNGSSNAQGKYSRASKQRDDDGDQDDGDNGDDE